MRYERETLEILESLHADFLANGWSPEPITKDARCWYFMLRG